MFRFNSIRGKLLAIYVPVTCLSILILFSILEFRFYQNQRADLLIRFDRLVALQSLPVAEAMWEYDTDKVQSLLDDMKSLPYVRGAAAYDNWGEIQGKVGQYDSVPESPEFRKDRKLLIKRNPQFRQFTGRLVVVIHGDDIWKEVKVHIKATALNLFVLAAMLVGVTMFVTREVIGKPIERLKTSIDRMRTENVRESVEWESSDELGEVVRAYNEMQNKQVAAESELKKHQEDLEDIVRVRTQELAESEQRLLSILEFSPIGTQIVLNQDLKVVYANDRLLEMRGVTRDEYVGRPASSKYFADSGQQKKIIEQMKSGKDIIDQEFQLKREDESTYWALMTVFNTQYGGEPARISWYYDITDRKRIQQSLEFVQYAVDHAVDMAFWLTLEDARLFYVNSTGAKRMGYTQEEMVGMQISQIDPEFPAERWPEFADRLRSGEPLVFESTHKTRDGQRYPVEITAQYVEFGDEKQVIAFARDITDRKRDQEELANMSMEASLLYRSTRIAEEASTFNDTLQGVVKIFCEIIGWPVGHVYLISDDDETLLEPTDIWHLDDPESYTKFHEVTQRTTFKIGEGLPGRILESTKPAWIVNVQTDPNFPRNQKATSIEVKGAFGFPIKVQGKVFAVCEFFALEEMESNPHFLSLAGPVGDQIGRIFERKLAQQEVASQNAIIKTIMENMNQGILMVDRDMNIVTSNPGFDEILGIDADWRDRFSTYREIVTYFYEEIVGAENAAEIIERAVDIVRSGNTMVHEQEIQDGRFMEMRQTKLDDGGVVRTYTDTTDRKQAEEILRESEERLLAMLDGSPVGVRIVRDSDSIIIFANARMEELFHLSKEDFLGTKTGDYHVDLNNQEAIVARFRKEGFVRDAEVQMKRPDGGTFWALLSIAPFEYEGEPARLVWFYEITKLKETEEKLLEARSELESRVEERTQELRREIVERQNAEEKLRNAEKMQALGTLAGGIAHNFNNALVPIIALSGIVQRKIPKENPNHEMLGKIAEGAERAQDLVAQIMSFSRQDESKLENVDATALV